MSAGITRVHGTAQTGASLNVTGTKSSFFSGYQPLFVTIQTLTSKYDFTTGYNPADGTSAVDSEFDQLVRAAETVGSVIMYGIPANANSSSTVVIAYDAGSVNQGDGAGGQGGATTGFGALKAALASVTGGAAVASDFAVATYTGFTGASLS